MKKKTFFECQPKDICYEKYFHETPWEEANPNLRNFILVNEIKNEFGRR